MKEQRPKVAPALLLLFSIGSVTPLHAEPGGARPLSENCRKASAAAGSFATSVSKILCQEERTNEEVFGSLLRVTNNLTGRTLTDLEETPPPPPPAPVVKPPSTTPPKSSKEQAHNLNKRGDNFASYDKAYTSGVKRRRPAGHKDSLPKPPSDTAGLEKYYYIGRPLEDLTPAERNDLRRKLEALLTNGLTWSFLNAIRRCEGGGPCEVVGGTHGKSADCRRRIRKLNLSGHPKEQGLPNRCFLYTSHGLSTAAGNYQIVYYRNWKRIKKLLGLKDFSLKSQAIAALELVRTSSVRGGKVGEGLVALAKGDLDRAVRKGSDPWACSPFSRWKGRNPGRLLQYARQERKKMENERLARLRREGRRQAENS